VGLAQVYRDIRAFIRLEYGVGWRSAARGASQRGYAERSEHHRISRLHEDFQCHS